MLILKKIFLKQTIKIDKWYTMKCSFPWVVIMLEDEAAVLLIISSISLPEKGPVGALSCLRWTSLILP